MKFSSDVLLGTASVVALASAAHAQTGRSTAPVAAAVQEVVVTGSRVIRNGNEAPTPVTVLPTEELTATTPANIPDALNRLPQFVGQPGQRNLDNGSTNPTGNYLNLRRFGANRTLILLDGTRVPPTASSGAVDANTLPQMLIQRVEVVTGGASAVYGSDAVTGVVNFILNKNFSGLKVNSQIGISGYGDNETWRIGIAAGGSVFGGRGHLEGSFEHTDSAGIRDMFSRDGAEGTPTVGGDGTAGNPTRIIPNGRLTIANPGGLITGTPPAVLRDITFGPGGVPLPFVHGGATGVNGLESGGSGGTYNTTDLMSPLVTNQLFARFSYDLTDNIKAYAQAAYNNSSSIYNYLPAAFLNLTIYSGNAFLNPGLQQILTANKIPSFSFARRNDRSTPYDPLKVEPLVGSTMFQTGIEGPVFGDFKWNANYVYARNTQKVIYHNNVNNEKLAAAVDAVINPATGRVVCNITLTLPTRFPDCEPINLFGPTSITASALDYVSEDTRYTLTNVMHDANVSLAGSLFSTWAGPVNLAISGEYRWLSISNRSNAQPTRPFDCSGLRQPCSTTAATYSSNTTTDMPLKSQHVEEIAIEALVPLAKDLPLMKSLELNLAGRYTDYSTSGTVQTWKLGGTWKVTDDLHIRATRSQDIRAPTLTDLFRPRSGGPTGYTDLHTGTGGILTVFTQGNPDLVPEVAKTTTVGIIYQPNWLPRFSIAVDYFDIAIDNAITTQGVGAAVQRECEDSNGTSPLCANFQRPLPFSDRSPANRPTLGFSQSLNAQKQTTAGVDIETNYRFDLADFARSLPGSLAVRTLLSYQPHLRSQTITSVPPTETSGIAAGQFGGVPGMSKLRVNASLNYTLNGLTVVLTERWQSSQQPSDRSINVDLRPDIPPYSYTDMSITYKTEVAGHSVTPFFTVENLFDKGPPIAGNGSSLAGLDFPSFGGYDVVGRYFTIGLRATY